MYLEGNSSTFIARYLTNKKIKTPSEYMKIVQYKKTNMYSVWKSTQILRILKNEVYIGNTVRNVENKIAYNKKGKRKTNKDEWIITKNTHEPIISQDDFNKVQEIIKSKNGKAHKLKYDYLLRPYIYCGKCGRKVAFNIRHENLVYLICPKSVYNCCEHYYYNYFKLEKQILQNIKEYYEKFFDYEKLKKTILDNSENDFYNKIDKKIKDLLFNYNRINDKVDSLYMERLDNKISDDEYKEKMQKYNSKRETINKELSDCEEIKKSFNIENLKQLEKMINNEKIKTGNNISRELLNKLIYKIELSKENVEVKYKFKFF